MSYLEVMTNNRDAQIEQIVMAAILEASDESFYGAKAARLLLLRSDIDKKIKEENTSSTVKKRLEEVSHYLMEAERILGEFTNNDLKPVEYVSMPSKKEVK